jgi:pyridoxine/pyridoxamine 5'-phosphate oxidase
MTKKFLLDYFRTRKFAVQASVDGKGNPQAAVIGIAVTPALHLVFDTLKTSRKYRNLKKNPCIALVVGWDETTVQYEGLATELTGAALKRRKPVYFKTFPDGRERERSRQERVEKKGFGD